MESVQASGRGGARRGERVGGCGRANEVLYDRQTGKSRGFAFLTMSCVEDYNAVIENLDERVFETDFEQYLTQQKWHGTGMVVSKEYLLSIA
nr:28 kDa ribonucleoprotein, chloroplastic [Ipomoea batatas]